MKNNQINKIIILLIIFIIVWLVYNYIYENDDPLKNLKIAEVPNEIKCFFGENQCEEGNIDGWTLVHGVVYFIAGLISPGHYSVILVFSIIFEIVKAYLGKNPRYIINPLANMTGYVLGSLASSKPKFNEKYKVFAK